MSVKNIVSYALGPVGSALLGLITLPVLTRLIVPDVYAQITLAQVTIQLLLFYSLAGFDQAFMRDYYEQEDKQRLFNHSFYASVVFFISVLIALFLFRNSISDFLFGQYHPIALALLASTVIGTLSLRYFQIIFRLEELALKYSLTLFLQAFLNLAFIITFIALLKIDPLLSVLLANLLSVVLVALYAWTISHQYIKVFKLCLFDSALFKSIFKYAFPLLFSSLLMWVLYSADQYMLRWLSSTYELGVYAAAYKLCAALTIMQVITSTYWIPLSLKWHQRKVPISFFNRAGALTTLIVSFVFFMSVALRDLITWLLGQDFAMAVEIFPFLMMYPLFYTLSEVTGVGISLSKRTDTTIFITLLAAATNISCNYWLIPTMGAKGAAIATALTFIVFFYARSLVANHVWHKVSLMPHHVLVIACLVILSSLETQWIEWAAAFAAVVSMSGIVFKIKKDRHLFKE